MTELKTLKDLLGSIDTNILKQEAIKWIKEISIHANKHWEELNEKGFLISGFDPYNFQINGLEIGCWHEDPSSDSIILWIKHFFNITEEDLK